MTILLLVLSIITTLLPYDILYVLLFMLYVLLFMRDILYVLLFMHDTK